MSEAKKIDHPAEFRRLLEEASADWPEALGLLGAAYFEGIGAKKDTVAGTAVLKRGIARGDPVSMFNYARYLWMMGEKKPPLREEARKLFVDAAAKGHPDAVEFCKRNDLKFTRKQDP